MTGKQFRAYWEGVAYDYGGDLLLGWAAVAATHHHVTPRTVRRWAKLKRIHERVLAAMPK